MSSNQVHNVLFKRLLYACYFHPSFLPFPPLLPSPSYLDPCIHRSIDPSITYAGIHLCARIAGLSTSDNPCHCTCKHPLLWIIHTHTHPAAVECNPPPIYLYLASTHTIIYRCVSCCAHTHTFSYLIM